ncbi:autotransporter-associated beta strand repeat-containing protein [Pseudomonas sp. LS44]|uniref:autotransporter-associated beta strand repeat-containing protein n=1 Tax=Pseudomonas sp. LS44 TaxID=1357074 RepID=UPI00215A75AE|nr:autotransporter-associated beta strand repeat-containing protein [Pseudomonas sp. LS44]UVE19151.1 autotransporter-associated beta strand repeat-containing protein [Pseudomonas sp. LS44]
MNRIFSLVWKPGLGGVVAASEHARRGTGPAGANPANRLKTVGLLSLLLLEGLAGSSALAATRHWDSNTAAAGLGGSGAWNASNNLWGGMDGVNGPFASWNNAALDDADFRGTAGTVTLSGALTAHNLIFNTPAYILTGGTLTLGGSTPTINTAANATINSVVAGSAGLTKDGAATLTLGGVSTYTGATTISGGVLQLAAGNNRLPTATDVNIANAAGVALNLNNRNQQIASLTGGGAAGGAVTLGSGTLTINKASGSSAFAGIISGTGGLTKAGASTQILSGSNTYSGLTTVSAGILNIQNNTALGATSGATTVAVGAELQLQGGITVGAEALTLNGTGIGNGGALHSVSGNNSYAGAVTLAGNSRINSDAGLLTLNGATISGATRSLTVGGAGDTTINNVIATTTGGLTKDGSGTLILNGANTYSGATTINAGTLQLGTGNNRLSTATAVTIANVAGATLNLNGFNQQVASLAGGGSTGGAVALGSGTLTINKASGSSSFAGTIGGTGGLTKTGVGTQILSGTNTYGGATTVSAGILNIQNSNALGTTSGATTVASGAELQLQGNIAVGAEALTLNGTGIGNRGALHNVSGNNSYAGAVTLGSNSRMNSDAGLLTLNGDTVSGTTQTLTVGGAGNTLLNNSIATTSGGLTKDGTGKLTLTGASTYGGVTTVSAGALNIQNSLALGSTSGATTVATGAELQLQGGISVGAEALTLNGTGIGNGGALHNIAGDNSYAGAVTLAGNSRINSDTGLLTLNGATLSGATRTLTVGGAGNTAINNVIATTTGSLTKDGSGTLTLMGANTYSGVTTVSAGILNIQNAAALGATSGATSATSVASGAELQLQGGITVGAEALTLNGTGVGNAGALHNVSGNNSYAGALTLAGNSRINSDAGLLTLNGATIGGATRTLTVGGAGNTTINNVIATTTGGLTKDGSGTLILNGASTFTGATTINAGTLQLGTGNNRLSTSTAVSIADVAGATLNLNGFNQQVASLAGGGATGGSVALGGGTLTVNRASGSSSFAGDISGTGGLTKAGVGTQILAGNNTYSGATTINAGALNIQHGNALGATSGATSVASGAELQLQGDIVVGAEALTLNGTGISSRGALHNVAGNNSYAGAVTLAGNSRINSDAGLLTLSGATLGGATRTLTVGGAGNTTINNVIATTTGGLTKDGNGTLTLVGANTYSGLTTISAGALNIQNGNALGTTSGATTVANGAELQLQGDIAVGAEALTLNGTGIGSAGVLHNVSGNNSYAGTVTLVGNSRINSDAGLLTLNGATLSGATRTLTVGGAGNTTINNVIATTTGGLVKEGSGNLSLNGLNTYIGVTSIRGGNLQISTLAAGGATSAIGASSSAASNLLIDGGALRYIGGATATNRNFTIGAGGATLDASGSGALTWSGGPAYSFANTAANLTLTGTAASNVFSGALLNNGSGGLAVTKAGSGSWNLTGSSSNFATLQMQQGMLGVNGSVAVTNTSFLGADTTLNIASGATLQASATTATNLLGSTGQDTINVATGGLLRAAGDLADGDDQLLLAGALDTGTGGLSMGAGNDWLTLRDGASLSGLLDGGSGDDTVLLDNVLAVSISGAGLIGFEHLSKQNVGTVSFTGSSTIAAMDIAVGTSAIGAADSVTGVQNTNVASGATLRVDGSYSGSAGADRLVVSGTISGSGSVDLGAGDDSLTLNDGADLSALSAGLSAGAGDDSLIANFTGDATLGGVSDFERLNKTNSGILHIDGTAPSDFVEVAIDAGTLAIGPAGSVTGAQTTRVASGATLQVDGNYSGSAGADSLLVGGVVSGNGTIDLGDGDDRLAVTDGADLSALSSALMGGAGNDIVVADIASSARLGAAVGFESLEKLGVGTLGIYGPVTSVFDRVQVRAGTLLVASGVTVDPQATVVAGGATLQVDGNYLGTLGDDTFDVSGAVTGSGNIDLLSGADVLTLRNGASLIGFTGPLDGGSGVDTVRLDGFQGSLPSLINWEGVLLNNSALTQRAALDLGQGTLDIGSGSSWQPGSFALAGNVNNGGVIHAAANRVAISGNYRSPNDQGRLEVLVSPATQSAGGLAVAGDVQGSTQVLFGSDNSQQTSPGEILVISSPNDDLATAASFVPSTLDSGMVRLNGSLTPWNFAQQADRNWYLTPLSGQSLPEVSGYSGTTTLGSVLAEQALHSSDERFAEVRACQQGVREGRSSQACGRSWSQVSYSDANLASSGDVLDGNVSTAYLGYDQLHQGQTGEVDVLLGAYFGYQDADFDARSPGASSAQIDVSAPTAVVYGSLSWANQTYLDLSLSRAWLDSQIKTPDAFSQTLHGRSWGASAKLGRHFPMRGSWSLEPQVELDLSHQDWDSGTDPSGKRVELDTDLRSRLETSLRVDNRLDASAGMTLRPWAKIGASYVLSGESGTVQLSAGNDQQRIDGLDLGGALSLSAGMLLELNEQLGVFASVSHSEELSGADYQSTEGRVGVQLSW